MARLGLPYLGIYYLLNPGATKKYISFCNSSCVNHFSLDYIYKCCIIKYNKPFFLGGILNLFE